MFTRDAGVVALLLASGADVRARSKVGETALMDAAARGDLSAAKLLLKRGADVNADRPSRLHAAAPRCGVRPRRRGAGAPASVQRGRLQREGRGAHGAEPGRTARTDRGHANPAGSRDERERGFARTLQAAAQKSLDLLVKTSPTFIKKGGCNSCHNQMLPAAAQAFARGRGIDVGEPIEQLAPELSEATAERYAEYSVGGGGSISALSFELFARDLAKRSADARVRAQNPVHQGPAAAGRPLARRRETAALDGR
jgi:hypothetical protein